MSKSVTNMWVFAALLIAQSFCATCVDVMLDGLLVTRVKQTEHGSNVGVLQSNVWLFRAASSLVASVTGGVISGITSLQTVCVLTACSFVPIAIVTYHLDAASTSPTTPGMCNVVRRACNLVTQNPLRNACIFVFVCVYFLYIILSSSLGTPLSLGLRKVR